MICRLSVKPATVFIWIVKTFASGFMSTDGRKSKIDPESFLALVQSADVETSEQDPSDSHSSALPACSSAVDDNVD